MKTYQGHVQLTEDDVQSIHPSVIKLSRHLHNRSVKSRRHYLSSSKSCPRKTIHATIRTKNNTHVARTQSVGRHNILSPISTITDIHQHNLDESKRTSITSSLGKFSKNIRRSVSVTKIHPIRPLLSQSSQNSWKNNNSRKNLQIQRNCLSAGNTSELKHNHQTIFKAKTSLSETPTIIHHQESINDYLQNLTTINPKLDQLDTTNDYHNTLKRNKKKKCSRLCIIAFIIGAFILIIGIIAILLPLLIKSTATETTTPTTTRVITSPIIITSSISLINPCTNGIFWNTTGVMYAGNASQGPGMNQLSSPTGIFIGSNDTLYINDGGNCRIVKYLPGASSGTLVAGTGTFGTGLTDLAPTARFSYVDSNQNIYIGDTNNHRIMRWANGASIGMKVAGDGTLGAALNQTRSPAGVWVDSNLNIFVAESSNHRVTKWTSSATVGIVVAGGNGGGIASNQLFSPAGLFYDETNQDLYIVNNGADAVMKWNAGASTGTVVAGIAGSSGSTSTELRSPQGLTLDQWNNIYVADRFNSRIQLFCSGNSTGITIAGFGSGGNSLVLPYGVALDSHFNLYVSENGGACVTKFYKL